MNVTAITDGILVRWSQPLFPNGVLQYEVVLQRMNLARPVIVFQNLTGVTSERELTFSVDILPYHLYPA